MAISPALEVWHREVKVTFSDKFPSSAKLKPPETVASLEIRTYLAVAIQWYRKGPTSRLLWLPGNFCGFHQSHESETRPDTLPEPKWFGNKNMLCGKPTKAKAAE